MSKSNASFNLELFFTALGDRTRLRLINLMGRDEICVCFFVEILDTNQPKISRHLAYLKKAGLVATRRDGNWMHYRLVEPPEDGAAQIFKDIRVYLAKDPEMIKDRAKLVKVCCAPTLPASVAGAPIPASLLNSGCSPNCS